MLTPEATNFLIFLGGIIGTIMYGFYRAVKTSLAKQQEANATHIQKTVAEPLSTSLANISNLLDLQRTSFQDVIRNKDTQLAETTAQIATLKKTVDDYKVLADQSLTDREGIRVQLNEVLEKQKARDLADQHRDDQIKALEEANKSKDAIIEELRTKITALETSLTTKDTDLAIANATIAELNRQLDEAKALNIEVTQLKLRVEALEAQVNSLMDDKEKLVLENAQLKQQLVERDATIADLRAQLERRKDTDPDATLRIRPLADAQDALKADPSDPTRKTEGQNV